MLLHILALQVALRPFPKAPTPTVASTADTAAPIDPMAHCELAATVAIVVALVNVSFLTSGTYAPVGFRHFHACLSSRGPDLADPSACSGSGANRSGLQVPGGDLILWFVLYTPYVAVVHLFSYCVFH